MNTRSNGATKLLGIVLVAIMGLAALPAVSSAATSKGSVKQLTKQVKALKKATAALAGQVTALQAKLSAVEGKAPSSLTGLAGGDLSGSFPNPQLRAETIVSSDIADGSILGADLAQNSIFSSNILDGSVGADEIANGTIGKIKLAEDSVGAEQLGPVFVVEGTRNIVNSGGGAGGSAATCPPESLLLSGGGNWDANSIKLSVTTSGPSQLVPNRWEAGGRNDTNLPAEFFATALCLAK